MKILLFICGLFLAGTAYSTELISIQSPYTPTHSGYAPMLRIIDQANLSQKKYRFIMESKPGAEQLIAIRQMEEQPQNRLAIVAAKYAEHVSSGKVKREDHVPVHALGDACWAVLTNVGDEKIGIASLKGLNEILVGGPGIGNATHLTSLQLGEAYNFKVRYIAFKSSYDALLLLAGDGSINMVLEKVESYEQFKDKSPRLKILAMNCPHRHQNYPAVKTLAEQGIHSPYVFNATIAHRDMPADKRAEISKILDDATRSVGEQYLKSTSWSAPIFTKTNTTTYFNNAVSTVDRLIKKHQQAINESLNN